jgi:lipoprotein-releasing system permease protein
LPQQPARTPAEELRALRDRIVRVNGHVIILKSFANFSEYRTVASTVESIDGVVAAEPFVFRELVIASAGHAPVGCALKGVDPQGVTRVLDLGAMFKVGKPQDLAQREPPAIILGEALASALQVHAGDSVVVTTVPRPELDDPTAREARFQVTGILHTEVDQYDQRLALVSLGAAQQLVDRGDQVVGLEIRVRDINRSDEVVRAITDALGGSPYEVTDWFELNKDLFGDRRP